MVSPLEQKPDYLVCTCLGVMYSEIVECIKNGATTYEQVQNELLVGTGCSSCVEEVYNIIAEEVGA